MIALIFYCIRVSWCAPLVVYATSLFVLCNHQCIPLSPWVTDTTSRKCCNDAVLHNIKTPMLEYSVFGHIVLCDSHLLLSPGRDTELLWCDVAAERLNHRFASLMWIT